MKKTRWILLIFPAVFVLICVVTVLIGRWVYSIKKEEAQAITIDCLYEALQPIPELSQMPDYGEFYLVDGDNEYLIVKNGDTVIFGKRDVQSVAYYKTTLSSQEKTPNDDEQQNILNAIKEAVTLRLASEGSYTCRKNVGPWELRVMPESEWIVNCERSGCLGTETLTYAEYSGEKRIGWAIYDDDVILYVYFSSASKYPEDDPQYVFGWGELEWRRGETGEDQEDGSKPPLKK